MKGISQTRDEEAIVSFIAAIRDYAQLAREKGCTLQSWDNIANHLDHLLKNLKDQLNRKEE